MDLHQEGRPWKVRCFEVPEAWQEVHQKASFSLVGVALVVPLRILSASFLVKELAGAKVGA